MTSRIFSLVLALAILAITPKIAFAAAARGLTFEEEVAQKIIGKLQNSDMRVRVTPVQNVCGTGREGYSVEVLAKVLRQSADGQIKTQLVHVKNYGAIETVFFSPKIVECLN